MRTTMINQKRISKEKSLPYEVLQDDDTYHIVFNLPESHSTHMISIPKYRRQTRNAQTHGYFRMDGMCV